MCKACAARACAFANSVYNRRSSATNFTLMMGMVMLSICLVWPELSIPVKNRLCGFGSLLSKHATILLCARVARHLGKIATTGRGAAAVSACRYILGCKAGWKDTTHIEVEPSAAALDYFTEEAACGDVRGANFGAPRGDG
jgi:hypothetical protein